MAVDFAITGAHIISTTGTGTAKRYLHPPSASGKWTLEAIYIDPATAQATDGSNYLTLAANKGIGGTAIGSVTTNSTGGVALVLGTRVSMSLSGAGSKSFDSSSATDCLELDLTKAGTGATFHGDISVVWRRARD